MDLALDMVECYLVWVRHMPSVAGTWHRPTPEQLQGLTSPIHGRIFRPHGKAH